jgi:hypothetical protein
MEQINSVSPIFWASSILITGALFAIFWTLDALQHKELVHIDITENELKTHRIILLTSMLMELSLIAMFWFPIEALPFFIALLFTRTAHEFMDELKYHMDRCSMYETMLHLAMWISVLANTVLMFMWGFFTQYIGLCDLHPSFLVCAFTIFIVIMRIGYKEWKR